MHKGNKGELERGSVSPFKVLKNLINGADYLARRGISLVHTVEGVGFPRDIDVDMMRVAPIGYL